MHIAVCVSVLAFLLRSYYLYTQQLRDGVAFSSAVVQLYLDPDRLLI